MKDLTIDQIRTAMDEIELSYTIAMDNGAEGLASAIRDKLQLLWAELIEKIRAEDPYTTEADIRYFEGRSSLITG